MPVDLVQWQPWGTAAFAKAREERKPVLLSINAVWCHWCHVQRRTVYGNPDLAKQINEALVPVRVDTDRRPDINERYNQGGWPSTVFLNPDGRVLAGGTYVPPEQFGELLFQVAKLYPAVGAEGQQPAFPEPVAGALEPRIVEWIVEKLRAGFDSDHGGFGAGQKFPMPEALRFLLEQHERAKGLLEMVVKTLEGMQGIFDKEVGGFYRYAMERDWSQPHYEKMLETNAELLEVLALAYQRTKQQEIRDIATKTASFLLTALQREGGGFWGSVDADQEESYYGKPLAERAKLPAPAIDKTVYCEWNGLALRGLSAHYAAAGDADVKKALESTAEFLITSCWKQGSGFCRFWDGQPRQFGLLLDNVEMGHGLLAAGSALGRKEWIAKARETADLMLAQFQEPTGTAAGQTSLPPAGGHVPLAGGGVRGFRDRLPQPDDAGLLLQPLVPFAGNARAARFLLALAKETKEQRYADVARKALERFAGSYLRYGIHAGDYGSAVAKLLAD